MTSITISCGSKADAVTVNIADLGITESAWRTSAALRYIVEYGLKQSLNDTLAAVKTDAADYRRDNANALVLKRLDAILTGTVRQPGTRDVADPIGVEAKKLARAAFVAAPKATQAAAYRQLEVAGFKGTAAEGLALIVGKMAETPTWREAAEKSIAARKEAIAGVGGLDLAALGLVPTES